MSKLGYSSSATSVATTCNSSKLEDSESDSMLKNLNAVVLQYLANSGLEGSYTTFCRECKIRGIPLPEDLPDQSFFGTSFLPFQGEQLLNHFDEENGKEMLQLWSQLVADMEPPENEAVKIITFYLQTFAATIPYRQDGTDVEKQQGMDGLREFFNEKPGNLINENVLTLFALPFVTDPTTHPIFKKLFEDAWRDKLRSQLSNVIRHHFQTRNTQINYSCELSQMFLNWMRKDEVNISDRGDNPRTVPALLHLHQSIQTDEVQIESQVDANSSDSESSSEKEETQSDRINDEIHHLKKSFHSCEDRYYKLLRVTAEVVCCLEQAIQGKTQNHDIEDLMNRLNLAFPELFRKLISEEIERQTIKSKKRIEHSNKNRKNIHPDNETQTKKNRKVLKETEEKDDSHPEKEVQETPSKITKKVISESLVSDSESTSGSSLESARFEEKFKECLESKAISVEENSATPSKAGSTKSRNLHQNISNHSIMQEKALKGEAPSEDDSHLSSSVSVCSPRVPCTPRQPRKTWAESIRNVDKIDPPVVTKSNIVGNTNVNAKESTLRKSRSRQGMIDDMKQTRSKEKKVPVQTSSKVSTEGDMKEKVTPRMLRSNTAGSRLQGNRKKKLSYEETITPEDLERRYQWFNNPDNEIQRESGQIEPVKDPFIRKPRMKRSPVS